MFKRHKKLDLFKTPISQPGKTDKISVPQRLRDRGFERTYLKKFHLTMHFMPKAT